ncbi:hypothetical protein IV73_GL000935 [Weissella kandleri]|uniref:Endonuclease MutS2 n=1 Tax=Weissella kandleri TaxID=1616 RepID=A0A0R2JIU8_9LACO|nr:endonuclease MutS2 [Weissella kandleri]KRN75173.1 hypothetical protein IV73_GL000935 [Weissella kandleri]
MNSKILKTLEYDAVKAKIKPFLMTAGGEIELEQLHPTTDAEQIQQWLAETSDAYLILRRAAAFQMPRLADIKSPMQRVLIDADLNGSELVQVGRVLWATGQVEQTFVNFATDQGEALPALMPYVKALITLPDLSKSLRQALDQDGRLQDDASAELHRLRQAITGTENAIRQKMQDYTRGNTAKYLSDPIVTMRNDRYVVPVKAEYRSKLSGVVHDQSQTGQTLYVEPAPVVDMNNRLREYQLKAYAEEQRVLHELSQRLKPEAENILHNAALLGHLDFVLAKGQYAVQLGATEPAVSATQEVNLIQARHPLLDQAKAVANDIILGKDYTAIIVTGPNTGGKTINLKTLGLLQLMAQSGLFLPTAEHSTVGVFDNVFADIGDEQSIEQSLSTFSSHMVNIIEILKHLTKQSLVLFDELGAGTDPQEGAALAMAILDAVGEVGAYTVATTHYPELKVYGYNRAATINASMEFDIETLQPTYHLLLGIPGRSNALDIAQRLGLPTEIVQQARGLTDNEAQELNEMIQDLVDQRNAVRTERVELDAQLADNQQQAAQLAHAQNQLEVQKAQLLQKAQQEANHIVADTRKKTQRIIDDLHQMQRAGAAGIKENKIIDAKGSLNQLQQTPTAENNRILRKAKAAKNVAIEVGDTVLVREYGQQGTIVRKLKDGKYEVQIGILKMVVGGDEIEKQTANPAKQNVKKAKASGKPRHARSVSTNQAMNRAHASATLDLRGERYEPAMQELDRFIDSALLNNLQSVEIIHGKGTGAIRKGVQEYLRSHHSVKNFDYTGPDQGATYVELA